MRKISRYRQKRWFAAVFALAVALADMPVMAACPEQIAEGIAQFSEEAAEIQDEEPPSEQNSLEGNLSDNSQSDDSSPDDNPPDNNSLNSSLSENNFPENNSTEDEAADTETMDTESSDTESADTEITDTDSMENTSEMQMLQEEPVPTEQNLSSENQPSYTALIPRNVDMHGTEGSTVRGFYKVSVTGEIGEDNAAHIVPDSGFYLTSDTGATASAVVWQDKTSWLAEEAGEEGNGTITVDDLKEGKWAGTMGFRVFLSDRSDDMNPSCTRCRRLIADRYSSGSAYHMGDYVTYYDILYKAETDIETPEPFDASKWTAVNVGDELKRLTDEQQEMVENIIALDARIQAGVAGNENLIGEPYEPDTAYRKGDYCIFDHILYRALEDMEPTATFDPSRWEETTAAGEFNDVHADLSMLKALFQENQEEIQNAKSSILSEMNLKLTSLEKRLAAVENAAKTQTTSQSGSFEAVINNWMGGSKLITFSAAFNNIPEVTAVASRSDLNVRVSDITKNSCVISWGSSSNSGGTWTVQWIATAKTFAQ